eukprot:4002232-Prorocentrum_lima.AAC.1
MAVAEVVGVEVSEADSPVDLPLHIPQFLGMIVDVAVGQLVHEHNRIPEHDLGFLDVLKVLDM